MVKTMSSVFVCVVLLCISAYCQLTPAQQQDFTTYRLYDEFFSRVQTVGRMHDRAEAQGKDRLHTGGKIIQNQIGLNDDEYKAVRTVAADCRSQLIGNIAQVKGAFQAFRASHPNDPVPDDLKIQRFQSGQQRKRIVFHHVAELRARLGDARFQQLDQWVRTSMHSSATTIGGK